MEIDCANEIVTLYFQGNSAARWQATKYAGSKGIKITSNEQIIYTPVIPNSPLLLHNIYDYPELDDVGYGWSWNPLHGLMLGVSFVQQKYFGIENAPLHHIYVTNLNLGGQNDVLQHQRALDDCIAKEILPNGKKLVLFGCSRGASTTFTSVATCAENLRNHIKLVILEAPFDTVDNVIDQSAWFPALLKAALKLTAYSDDQMSPLQAAQLFPLDVPVAFITSVVDARVPIQCTQNLINVLRERGHPNLHHLELRNSPHSSMSLADETDQKRYVEFVNSLYAKYL